MSFKSSARARSACSLCSRAAEPRAAACALCLEPGSGVVRTGLLLRALAPGLLLALLRALSAAAALAFSAAEALAFSAAAALAFSAAEALAFWAAEALATCPSKTKQSKTAAGAVSRPPCGVGMAVGGRCIHPYAMPIGC